MANDGLPSIINLNVGGQFYTTTRSTLTKDPESMLGIMFSDESNFNPSERDDKGNYVIDADGCLFRYVLGFMRHGKLDLPKDFKDLDLLITEGNYYQNNKLSDAIKAYQENEEKTKKRQKEQAIQFNVGGKIHTTLRSTLMQHFNTNSFNKPSRLLNIINDPEWPRDSQGCYVIDRDSGDVFRHVLGFFRSGKLNLPTDFSDVDLLSAEANYYENESLITAIRRYKYDGGQEVIHFNVGGKIYTTLRSTCEGQRPSSRLSDIINDPKSVRDSQGRYVIDRDGDVFRHVLNCIRNDSKLLGLGTVDHHRELEQLDIDSHYYRVHGLDRAIYDAREKIKR